MEERLVSLNHPELAECRDTDDIDWLFLAPAVQSSPLLCYQEAWMPARKTAPGEQSYVGTHTAIRKYHTETLQPPISEFQII